MPIEVDPRFKTGGQAARKRTRARLIRQLSILGGGLGIVAIIGVAAWLFLTRTPDDVIATPDPETPIEGPAVDGDDEILAMVADEERPVFDARATFIDLPKDPLILNFAPTDTGAVARTIEGPAALDPLRVGTAGPDQLTLIDDAIVVRSRRLSTTLPSSRADFAYFQTTRSDALALLTPADPQEELEEVERGDLVTVDGSDGSWGALISGPDDTTPDEVSYIETTIENIASLVPTIRDVERTALYRDEVIALQTERPIAELLAEIGLGRVQVSLTQAAIIRELGTRDALDPGMLMAARVRDTDGRLQLLQLSIYAGADYLGTIAQVAPGVFETAGDPWLNGELLEQSRAVAEDSVRLQDVRLLDGIYSAAIRGGMPSTLVGEMMVMLAQQEDLERFASPQDRFVAVFSTEPGITGQGAGQLLYAGVTGPSGDMTCYVVLAPSKENFECYRERAAENQMGGVGAGLLLPVRGTKTSDFGTRVHPILGTVRAHNGVDWGAPTGTPVIAAADGTISRANFSASFGNVVQIDHSGQRNTLYAHLNGFAEGLRTGQVVQAGDVIGYVGTTGRSTGPHLHFELRVNGNPVNPLTYTGPPTVVVAATTGSAAVEALVNQIIQVESAGNANAANPNSTARGLGQFIESTWLRMIDVYRPDLSGLSRRDKLQLRFNPELSREMVRHLAREGESYLRNRGHQITAGRLYLAHFLGAEGAHVALSANPNSSVRDVMGAGVVNANGFLRGRNIAWLWNWAERKMAPRGTTPPPVVAAAPAPEPMSEETKTLIEAMDAIVAAL